MGNSLSRGAEQPRLGPGSPAGHSGNDDVPPPSASQAKPQSFASTSMKNTAKPSVYDLSRPKSSGPGISMPSTRQLVEESIAATPPTALGVTPSVRETSALSRVAGQLLPVDPERLAYVGSISYKL